MTLVSTEGTLHSFGTHTVWYGIVSEVRSFEL